ncbi:MAG: ArsR/SmtB family transcription factor [Anaerolineae bacterium]
MSQAAIDYTQATEVLKLLAHPARLQILDELRQGEACVCHFQETLDRPQAYISQQLRLLREAGIVDSERDGVNMIYRIVDERIAQLLDEVLGPVPMQRTMPACPCPKCGEDSQVDGSCEYAIVSEVTS